MGCVVDCASAPLHAMGYFVSVLFGFRLPSNKLSSDVPGQILRGSPGCLVAVQGPAADESLVAADPRFNHGHRSACPDTVPRILILFSQTLDVVAQFAQKSYQIDVHITLRG